MQCHCSSCGSAFEAEPIGGHRVMCGDSTDPAQVGLLMAGEVADLCFTSPPYGQQRDYTAAIGSWDTLMQGVFAALPMRHDGQVLVNLGMVHRDNEWQPYWSAWIDWMRSRGWRRFGWYVWDQGPGLMGNWNGRLAPAHEWIFHFNRESVQARKSKAKKPENIRVRTGGTLRMADGSIPEASSPRKGLQKSKIPDSVVRVLRRFDDLAIALLEIPDEMIVHWPESVIRLMRHKGAIAKNLKHPAPFPVALPVEMLLAYSDAGDLLYEPFCGAGSTTIAAEIHGRRCFGMEIAPEYTDVIVERWQRFTGGAAVREADSAAFSEAVSARVAAE